MPEDNLGIPADEGSTLQIPPQVKFGYAIMEMTDGSVRAMPINPLNTGVTMGMMMRLLTNQLEDIRAELLARKILAVQKISAPPTPPDPGGLVDLS